MSPAPREADELRRGAGADEGILDLNEDDLRFDDELAPETGLMDPPLVPPFLDDDDAISHFTAAIDDVLINQFVTSRVTD